ncbi:4550_t:CDS:2 [Acaulospora morrowiae]|uniref:4550_t:CDS:1 n=1 Tax=Acaulospora morrowiae TaxID=94023 RepID=A0A9N9CG84_9GLOM|nr:4550_t:CDS:2 [Acaulospora morrowiae]
MSQIRTKLVQAMSAAQCELTTTYRNQTISLNGKWGLALSVNPLSFDKMVPCTNFIFLASLDDSSFDIPRNSDDNNWF